MLVFGVRIEVVGSVWWLVRDIGLGFGPPGRARRALAPGPKALGLDVSVLCQD